MARKRLPGKKKFKRTKFGARAIAGARSGTGGKKNPSGSRSSVKTATFDVPGRKGRTDVAVVPTIRKVGGKLKTFSLNDALKEARRTGDFVRVKGGKTQKAIEKARAKGDKKSRSFSKKLGKISAKRSRRRSA